MRFLLHFHSVLSLIFASFGDQIKLEGELEDQIYLQANEDEEGVSAEELEDRDR